MQGLHTCHAGNPYGLGTPFSLCCQLIFSGMKRLSYPANNLFITKPLGQCKGNNTQTPTKESLMVEIYQVHQWWIGVSVWFPTNCIRFGTLIPTNAYATKDTSTFTWVCHLLHAIIFWFDTPASLGKDIGGSCLLTMGCCICASIMLGACVYGRFPGN